MASWKWNETVNKKIDSKTDAWDKKIGDAVDNFHNTVTDAANAAGDAVTKAADGFLNKMNSAAKNALKDAGIEGGMEKIEISDEVYDAVKIREKLVLECPNFMKQCGVSQIDFGKMFLTPAMENTLQKTTAIATDVLESIEGVHQYITPEVLDAVQELISFVITDLTKTIINYCTNLFTTYVSPEFPISLAKSLTKKSLLYTKQKTKKPDVLLKELTTKKEEGFEKIQKDQEKEMQNVLTGKLKSKFSQTIDDINKILGEIEPYSNEISNYMKYGPDYAVDQVIKIYQKYLNIGIKYVNSQINSVKQAVDFYIDFAAKKTGEYAAEKLNTAQTKMLKKAIDTTNVKKQQLKLRATSLVNKAIMSLLAQLGG